MHKKHINSIIDEMSNFEMYLKNIFTLAQRLIYFLRTYQLEIKINASRGIYMSHWF